VALRAVVRARKDLVIHRVALANQLRAHLPDLLPRPGRAVPRARRRHQPEVPPAVRLPGPRRLAFPKTPHGVPQRYPLLGQHHRRGHARPAHCRPARRLRGPRRGDSARHPRPRHSPAGARHPD
jgi:hypothetical protein